MMYSGYFRIWSLFVSWVVLTESARLTAFGWFTIYARLIESSRKIEKKENNNSISNSNRTDWSPIQSVIIRVINKIGLPGSRSPIC